MATGIGSLAIRKINKSFSLSCDPTELPVIVNAEGPTKPF